MEQRRMVGNREYRILTSESDGVWHANVSPAPPPDGRIYTLPQWICKASSEAEMQVMLDRHFQDVLTAQST